MAPNKPATWPPYSSEEYRQQSVQVVGEELTKQLAKIKLLVFDCDGVMTPGNLIYGPSGEALKEFHSHDGLGLVMCRIAGLKRAVLTGRNSEIVSRRCTELRFDSIKLGRFDKLGALEEILHETGCSPEETLYMGDDLIDLPAMHQVAIAVGMANAPKEVLDFCHFVPDQLGGQGAVREICDLVLKSSGLYSTALIRLLDKSWHPTSGELSSDEELTQ
ncbi:MAG: HAD hydrolase family protein [bacterium]|nr:HAD hydrolase family protein [bacterium]